MHAAVVTDTSRPPTYAEFPDPPVPEDRLEAEVLASAVHQIVRAIAAGRHYGQQVEPPFVPGIDGVVRLADGRRVYTSMLVPPYGMLAERAAVRRSFLLDVPEELGDGVAAAIVNPAASSWVPLSTHLRSGDTVLVLGATGTSGLLAVQVAKLLGAGRVVAVGRDPDRLAVAQSRGADAVVPLGSDLEQALPEAVDGYDIVLDYVWGDAAARVLRALVAGGVDPHRPVRFVNLGSLAGDEIPVPAAALRGAAIQISGHGVGNFPPTRLAPAITAVLAAAAAGQLHIDVREHPLRDIEQVWARPERLVFLP